MGFLKNILDKILFRTKRLQASIEYMEQEDLLKEFKRELKYIERQGVTTDRQVEVISALISNEEDLAVAEQVKNDLISINNITSRIDAISEVLVTLPLNIKNDIIQKLPTDEKVEVFKLCYDQIDSAQLRYIIDKFDNLSDRTLVFLTVLKGLNADDALTLLDTNIVDYKINPEVLEEIVKNVSVNEVLSFLTVNSYRVTEQLFSRTIKVCFRNLGANKIQEFYTNLDYSRCDYTKKYLEDYIRSLSLTSKVMFINSAALDIQDEIINLVTIGLKRVDGLDVIDGLNDEKLKAQVIYSMTSQLDRYDILSRVNEFSNESNKIIAMRGIFLDIVRFTKEDILNFLKTLKETNNIETTVINSNWRFEKDDICNILNSNYSDNIKAILLYNNDKYFSNLEYISLINQIDDDELKLNAIKYSMKTFSFNDKMRCLQNSNNDEYKFDLCMYFANTSNNSEKIQFLKCLNTEEYEKDAIVNTLGNLSFNEVYNVLNYISDMQDVEYLYKSVYEILNSKINKDIFNFYELLGKIDDHKVKMCIISALSKIMEEEANFAEIDYSLISNLFESLDNKQYFEFFDKLKNSTYSYILPIYLNNLYRCHSNINLFNKYVNQDIQVFEHLNFGMFDKNIQENLEDYAEEVCLLNPEIQKHVIKLKDDKYALQMFSKICELAEIDSNLDNEKMLKIISNMHNQTELCKSLLQNDIDVNDMYKYIYIVINDKDSFMKNYEEFNEYEKYKNIALKEIVNLNESTNSEIEEAIFQRYYCIDKGYAKQLADKYSDKLNELDLDKIEDNLSQLELSYVELNALYNLQNIDKILNIGEKEKLKSIYNDLEEHEQKAGVYYKDHLYFEDNLNRIFQNEKLETCKITEEQI